MRAGEVASFSTLDEVPDETERANHERLGTRSSVFVPLSIEGGPDRGISFVAMRTEHHWSEAVLNRFRLVANIFANALARQRADAALRDRACRGVAAARRPSGRKHLSAA